MKDMADEALSKPPNIYLVGAQCTGKTTLLESLLEHFKDTKNRDHCCEPPCLIREVAREVMRDKGFNSADITKPDRGFELQKEILIAQYNAEENLRDCWYISDRSAIDPIVYAQVYLGNPWAEKLLLLPEWIFLRERMQKSIVILCAPGCREWLSGDDVRMTYEGTSEWQRFSDEFCKALKKHAIVFIVLRGELTDLGQRVQYVINAFNSRL